MDDNNYAVILYCDPGQKETHEKVVACLARLDPTAPARFEKMTTAGPLFVKRRTDRATANRLKDLLSRTGARCTIQKLTSPPPVNIETQQEPVRDLAASGQALDPLLIKCPRCGYQQPPTAECRACGIIIAKAKQPKVPAGIAASPGEKPFAPRGVNQRIADLIHRYAGPLEALIKRIQNPIGIRKLTTWARRLLDRLIRCGIVFVIALALEVGLLSLGKMLWYLYLATATGQYYLLKFPEKAEAFERIAQEDTWILGWDTTLTVLILCLLLAGAAQVLHLIRYLYESQGITGKLVLWFAPSAGATGWFVSQRHPFPEYALATMMVIVPILCMLSSCLYLARTALPEIGEFRKILTIITANRDKTWGVIAGKIRIWLDATK